MSVVSVNHQPGLTTNGIPGSREGTVKTTKPPIKGPNVVSKKPGSNAPQVKIIR